MDGKFSDTLKNDMVSLYLFYTLRRRMTEWRYGFMHSSWNLVGYTSARLRRSHSRCGRCHEQLHYLPLSEINPRIHGRPFRRLVTILSELTWVPGGGGE
jgi:hypothetical protein